VINPFLLILSAAVVILIHGYKDMEDDGKRGAMTF
jgi:hypothetical protein